MLFPPSETVCPNKLLFLCGLGHGVLSQLQGLLIEVYLQGAIYKPRGMHLLLLGPRVLQF